MPLYDDYETDVPLSDDYETDGLMSSLSSDPEFSERRDFEPDEFDELEQALFDGPYTVKGAMAICGMVLVLLLVVIAARTIASGIEHSEESRSHRPALPDAPTLPNVLTLPNGSSFSAVAAPVRNDDWHEHLQST